jgi:hypothetical protein
MNHVSRHPETGFHYLHVMPRVPEFEQIRLVYEEFAKRCFWTSVIDSKDFEALKGSEVYRDPNMFILSWDRSPAGPKDGRKAKVACLYSGPLGPKESMLSEHLRAWVDFSKRASEYDLILGNTPFATAELKRRLGVDAEVFPVGWEPAFGSPDWSLSRTHAYVYYGSLIGKRIWAMPVLARILGDRLLDKTGTFWGLGDVLRRSLATLSVNHSDVDLFSTWRIWTSLPAGSAMVSEPADLWPLEKDVHCLEIPVITKENVETVAGRLRSILSEPSVLAEAARRAWNEIAPSFTVDKCVRNYLVPASRKCLK